MIFGQQPPEDDPALKQPCFRTKCMEVTGRDISTDSTNIPLSSYAFFTFICRYCKADLWRELLAYLVRRKLLMIKHPLVISETPTAPCPSL
jgi:hypothetical protein